MKQHKPIVLVKVLLYFLLIIGLIGGFSIHSGQIVQAATGVIEGIVIDADSGLPIEGATVLAVGPTGGEVTTDGIGYYSIWWQDPGTYDVTVSHPCYLPETAYSIVVTDGGTTTQDFALTVRTDAFGYYCQVQTPAYIEANTVLALMGDDASLQVALPFSFPFYGSTYSEAWVATNGYMNFLAENSDFSNDAIPTVAVPNGAIYPFWDDLYVDALASVRTEVLSSPNRFIIEWRNVRPYSPSEPRMDFEVVLYEDGHILVQYRNIADDGREKGDSATLGIENADGTIALQCSYNEAAIPAPEFAFMYHLSGVGTLEGGVIDAVTALPVLSAVVQAVGSTIALDTSTDSLGHYTFPTLPPGDYDVTVSSRCYLPETAYSIVVTDGGTTTQDFALTARTDAFGYYCQAQTPAYIEANTVLPLTGDDQSLQITLPFSFPFYGTTYSQAWVSTNGYMNFLAANSALSNTAIPAAGVPNGAIYPFWDDLYVDASASVRTELLSSPNRFVIEWRNVRTYIPTSLRMDFEVVLYEDGHILVQYRNIADDPREKGNSATLGIENADGTIAFQYSYYEAAIEDPEFALMYCCSAPVLHPGFTLTKICAMEPVPYGDDAVFTIELANTGDVDLIVTLDEDVTDSGGNVIPAGSPFGLPEGETLTFTVTKPTGTDPTVENTVHAHVTLPAWTGLPDYWDVEASDSCDVSPMLELHKSFCDAEIQLGQFVRGKWIGGEWIPVSEWHILNGGMGDEQWYPKNQRIRWPVTFYLQNNTDEDMTDLVLRDFFGAEVKLLDMQYELDGVTYEIDEVGVGNLNKDPAVDENGIGFYKNKGSTNQLRFIWEIGDLPPGEDHTLTFYIVTDLNPGQSKKDLPKWEFTSCGLHFLNSGATVEWIDAAGVEQLESTEGWAIQVCKPTPVVTTEIQAPMIGDVAYILLEDTVQDEATIHNLEGVRGVNCDWYPAATGDVTFQFSEDGAAWTSWGDPIELTDETAISEPVGFTEVGRYYMRAVFESDDNNYGNSMSGALDEPLEVIQLSVIVDKTGAGLSKIGDLVDYTIYIENTSSGNVPPMFFDVVDAMLGVNVGDSPIPLGGSLTILVNNYEIPWDAGDPYVNEVTVHATVEGLPYEIDEDDSWETNLFQPSFVVSFAADDVVGVGDEIQWTVTIENTSSADSPDANVRIDNLFTSGWGTGVVASGGMLQLSFDYTAQEADRPQIEATLTVEITYDNFPNVFNFEETLVTVINSPPVADFGIDYTPISHCDQPVYFTDLSVDPDGDALDYVWDFGDGETSHQQDPSHTYDSPGTYTVELTVTDPYGGWDSITRDVEVTNSPPVSQFSVDYDYVSWCDSVQFTNLSGDPDDCDILSYYWDFGDDDGSSGERDPSYSYASPGVYTVELTVTDNFGESSSSSLEIEIYNEPPQADFNVDGATTRGWCDQPFHFTNHSSDPDSCEGGPDESDLYPLYYEWDFNGDGWSDSTEVNPSYSYALPGTYDVTLRVIDNHGSWDEHMQQVTVTNEAPVADFHYSPGDPRSGDSVSFYNDSYDPDTCDALTYEWDFDDDGAVDSTDKNPSYTFWVVKDYLVTLRVTDQFGSSDSETHMITVSA